MRISREWSEHDPQRLCWREDHLIEVMISQGGGTRGEPGIGSVAATGALEQLLDQLIGEAVPCGTRHALWHDDDHVPSLPEGDAGLAAPGARADLDLRCDVRVHWTPLFPSGLPRW